MILTGKRFVVTGIASKLSIAWAIAKDLHEQGATLILTYPNDKLKKRVDMAAQAFDAVAVLACDVSSDESIKACFDEVETIWADGIDGVVHAIGFAPAEQLDGDFTEVTTRDGFMVAHDVSSYSFIALAKASRQLLAMRQGSLLTLTYLGACQCCLIIMSWGWQRQALKQAYAIWQIHWERTVFVSMPFHQAQFAHWQPAVLSLFGVYLMLMKKYPLYNAMLPKKKWVRQVCFCYRLG